MEIDKILFGRLVANKDIEQSFEDLDVNNDGVINEEDKTLVGTNQALASQITDLLNSADEDAELNVDADFGDTPVTVEKTTNSSKSATTNNNTVTANDSSASSVTDIVVQYEIDRLNDKQEKIQDEIEEKEAEYKEKKEELEDKQEELEVLMRESQNDNSNASQISELQSKISTLSSELSTLASAIEKLESDYSANSITIDALSTSLQVSENTSETTTTSLDTASETQEAEKAGYRNASEEALAAAYTGEEDPPMIDSVGKGSMIDNSPNAIKIRNSVKNLSREPFKKLSGKDIEKHKNLPSTIKNPDGTYTAKTYLNGSGCITFDEEGNILCKTYTYSLSPYNQGSANIYASSETYDGSGRLLARTMHDGRTITYEYNDDGTYNKTVMNSRSKETTTYKYKNDGELISQESQSGVDEQKIKKAHAHTHSDGSYTIPHDASIYNPYCTPGVISYGGYKGSMTLFDCNGKPISQTEVTGQNSIKKCEEFDDEGRPLRYTASNGTIQENEYNEDGTVTFTTTTKTGRVTQHTYRMSGSIYLKEPRYINIFKT